jgi:hypothetical protein
MNLKTHLKKKRHRNFAPSNPHKKGPTAPFFDLRLSDDMDTSDLSETQPILPKDDHPKTPPHFFKAIRTRKKVDLSSQKLGDIELSPNPP